MKSDVHSKPPPSGCAATKLEDYRSISTTRKLSDCTVDRYTPWQPVDDWTALNGHDVEVQRHGKVIDHGRVEAVMADGSLLWLMQYGAHSRRIIEQQPGTYLRCIKN